MRFLPTKRCFSQVKGNLFIFFPHGHFGLIWEIDTMEQLFVFELMFGSRQHRTFKIHNICFSYHGLFWGSGPFECHSTNKWSSGIKFSLTGNIQIQLCGYTPETNKHRSDLTINGEHNFHTGFVSSIYMNPFCYLCTNATFPFESQASSGTTTMRFHQGTRGLAELMATSPIR